MGCGSPSKEIGMAIYSVDLTVDCTERSDQVSEQCHILLRVPYAEATFLSLTMNVLCPSGQLSLAHL